MIKKSFLFLIGILLVSVFLSGCTISDMTGKVISNFGTNEKCMSGYTVDRIIKGKTINLCCFTSSSEGRDIESCNSFDFDYSETTIIESGKITQRKLTFPMNGMSCTDIYGRLDFSEELELIDELSVCSVRQ